MSAGSNIVAVDNGAHGMVAMMERLALNPDVPVEKLERLLAMQERIMDREARAAYAAALARLQPKLPLVAERGAIKDRSGHAQSRYALWEDIVGIITPILATEGFSLSFRTASDKDSVTVTGVLTHEVGHSEQTTLTLPTDPSGSKNAVQAIGSSTSYGKRYTSAALLNLRAGEIDDDGRAGGGEPVITENQARDLESLIEEVGANKPAFLAWAKVGALEEIPARSYKTCVDMLRAKGRQQK